MWGDLRERPSGRRSRRKKREGTRTSYHADINLLQSAYTSAACEQPYPDPAASSHSTHQILLAVPLRNFSTLEETSLDAFDFVIQSRLSVPALGHLHTLNYAL